MRGLIKIVVRPAAILLLVAATGGTYGCGNAPAKKSMQSPAPEAFTLVELTPTDGELRTLLRAEFKNAQDGGRKPFVEVYADWCGPCKELRDSLDDPQMIDAFEGTHIIQLNSDTWGRKLSGAAISVTAIPVFIEINRKGLPTGRTIDGGAWGANVPLNMAPPLKRFFKG